MLWFRVLLLAAPGMALFALNGTGGSSFGARVSLQPSFLIVGAPTFTPTGRVEVFSSTETVYATTGISAGAAVTSYGASYAFGGPGIETSPFKGAIMFDSTPYDINDGALGLGSSMSMNSTLIAIGAPYSASPAPANQARAGRVYLFDTTLRRFTGGVNGTVPDELMGSAVLLYGQSLFIGAPGSSQKGAVLRYDLSTGLPVLVSIYSDGSLPTGSKFGSALTAIGSYLYIGAPYDKNPVSNLVTGRVFVALTSGGMVPIAPPFDRMTSMRFGTSIAVTSSAFGATVYVGAPRGPSCDCTDFVGSGVVFVFNHHFANNSLIFKEFIAPPSPSTYNDFGFSLSATDDNLAIGAPGRDQVFLLSEPTFTAGTARMQCERVGRSFPASETRVIAAPGWVCTLDGYCYRKCPNVTLSPCAVCPPAVGQIFATRP